MQLYVSKFADQYSKTVASMTTSQKRFLLDVLHVIRANIGTTRSRIKRQAESSASGRDRQRPRPVLRREIRILSERERADYFRAVNSLKMDTVRKLNKHKIEMLNAFSGETYKKISW